MVSFGEEEKLQDPQIRDMVRWCQQEDGSFWRNYCNIYFETVNDITANFELSGHGESFKFCFPHGYKVKDGVTVFLAWAEENESKQQMSSLYGVLNSLNSAYSCPK